MMRSSSSMTDTKTIEITHCIVHYFESFYVSQLLNKANSNRFY